jgi:nucleoside-diphosphate-sugar epimerase
MNKAYVLITGATGFIGSHVTEKLLSDKSYRLIAIVRKNRNYKNVNELENKGAILAEGNFYDKIFLEKIFNKFPVQYVVHIAALRGGGTGTKEDYYEVNVHGTEVLLAASLQNHVKKFIFCSSVGVFGTIPKEVPANLTTELNGDNEYHNSKILAERKVYDFISKGLNAFIIRPTITYGSRDNGFSATLVKLVRKRMLFLPFKDNKVHLLEVRKLAEIFMEILKTNNLRKRIFIAADEQPIILRELIDLVYSYYYGKKYPLILRMPSIVFDAFLVLFRALKNSKWSVRVQLLSRDWYYDTAEMNSLIEFRSANTEKEFLVYLKTLS